MCHGKVPLAARGARAGVFIYPDCLPSPRATGFAACVCGCVPRVGLMSPCIALQQSLWRHLPSPRGSGRGDAVALTFYSVLVGGAQAF